MLSVILAASLVQAATVPRPVLSNAQYFPLLPGTVWVYEVTGPGGGDRFVTTAPMTLADAAEQKAVELSGYFPGTPRWARTLPRGRVEEVGADGRVYLWYELGASPGTSWVLHLAGSSDGTAGCYHGVRLTLESRDVTLTVPAGTFQNVVLVRWESRCRDAGIAAEWFAPGVGLVQREEVTLTGTRLWRLREVRKGELSALFSAYGGGLSLSRRQYVLNLMPVVDFRNLVPLSGVLALWYRPSEAEAQARGVPGCLQLAAQILDSTGRVVVEAPVADPGCAAPSPAAAPVRFISFTVPLLARGVPLPQGEYTVRVYSRSPGWEVSFSLPFSVSHVY